jgi:hypothetical protein
MACLILVSLAAGPSRAWPAEPTGPALVRIVQTNGGYQLLVDHKPFYVKGAGLEFGSQEELAAHGGNSFRTWRTDNGSTTGQEVLDRAQRNGLRVMMGLEVGGERHGFDYNDETAVARQLERVKAEVLKYKDHPALIVWAIGNELNLDASNPKVWNAVNDISKMIHAVDPNHLTTTPIAGFKPELIRQVKTRAPDLDFLSFQMYADIVNLPRYLRAAGWTGPYMITEWGATGHWEVRKTDWGAPIENDSSTKADFYRRSFETAIQADPARCLGSYVFLWGQKQERTPTWYGMFLESGETTESVDVMQYLWTGAWPSVRCPRIRAAFLNGRTALQNISLAPNQSCRARVDAIDPNHLPLKYDWEVMAESTDLKRGGDFESKPKLLPGVVQTLQNGEVVLKAPPAPGAYRLFTYVFDGEGHAAHVNIPFYVEQGTAAALQASQPSGGSD